MLLRKIDEQSIKDLDFDVSQFLRGLQDKVATFLGWEEGLLLAPRIVHNPGHDQVEHFRRTLDDVEVAVRDRIVGAGADRDAAVLRRHSRSPLQRYMQISVSP